jgi:hypothetical protein
VLILGLLAHTCVFTPYQPIAFGKRGTTVSAAVNPGPQLPGKREGHSGQFGLVASAVAAWSVEPIVAGTVLTPSAPDIRGQQFQRTPLGSRPPPVAV